MDKYDRALLAALIDNGRLVALPEIATQFQGGFLIGRRGEDQVCHRGGKIAPRCRCTRLDQRDARAGAPAELTLPVSTLPYKQLSTPSRFSPAGLHVPDHVLRLPR